jgi:hypothetical protein
MKLCGFDVGLDQPFLPDRRHLLDRKPEQMSDGRGRPAQGNLHRAGHPADLQEQRSTRPTAPRAPASAARGWTRAWRSWRRCAPAAAAHPDRRARRGRRSRGGQRGRCAANAAFLCRQTDFIRAVAQSRQAGEHQEGPVPGPLGHEERHRQGPRRRARKWACRKTASWPANAA